MIIKCNLCTQTFDESELLIEEQKKRHRQFHKSTGYKRNIVIGDVSWVSVQ